MPSISPVPRKLDVLIVGGGAAGLMCAIQAGRRGRRVALLEHGDRIGKKILISGGGRCNFTNLQVRSENYLSRHPDFCKSALARFTPEDFLTFVEAHGIAYHEKKLGQLFCDGSSKQIVGMLERECQEASVHVECGCTVDQVQNEGSFHLITNKGEWIADSLVIATGGLSFSKLGATGWGYAVAKQFGLNMIQTRPGLVPLTLNPSSFPDFAELSGVSMEAIAKKDQVTFRENLLLTHRGLSGPAVLQISSYWSPGETLEWNLLPDGNPKEIWLPRRQEKVEFVTWLSEFLPRRFAQIWCRERGLNRSMNRMSNRDLEKAVKELQNWKMIPSGTEGYPKAEVTLGGVDTGELSSKTMECKKVPGLYFIGEVVDVTGWLGGYNFQWAWASGAAAGRSV